MALTGAEKAKRHRERVKEKRERLEKAAHEAMTTLQKALRDTFEHRQERQRWLEEAEIVRREADRAEF